MSTPRGSDFSYFIFKDWMKSFISRLPLTPKTTILMLTSGGEILPDPVLPSSHPHPYFLNPEGGSGSDGEFLMCVWGVSILI